MNKPYVFGIGLPKTGTCSLTAALNTLGIPSLHFTYQETKMSHLVKTNQTKNKNLLDPIDQQYRGFIDFNGFDYYETLITQYPNSVFIYTKREFVSWFRSRVFNHRMKILNGRERDFGNIDQAHISMVQHYFKHNKKIPEFFRDNPQHRYLEMDICAGDGWDKLCNFLELPVPQQPFPHDNKTNRQLILDRSEGTFADTQAQILQKLKNKSSTKKPRKK